MRRFVCAGFVAFAVLLVATPGLAQFPTPPYLVPAPASFQTPGADYPVQQGANDIAIGDFNGDGRPDIATANDVPETFSILLNNGDGSFQPAQNYPAPGSCSITTADFNGDGILDLAVSDCTGGALIFLGKGDGTFPTTKTAASGLGAFLWTPIVRDFNSDGKLDLAGALFGQYPNIAMDFVVVLLGNGDGTFQTPAIYNLGHGAWDIAAGDMNTDGRQDLVTTNTDGTVSVLFGNPDGSFQAATLANLALGGCCGLLAIGDLDRDGKPDLYIIVNSNYGIALGTGDGITYKTADGSSGYTEFTLNSINVVGFGSNIMTPSSRLLGDFNGDGFLDYASGGQQGSPAIEIGLGDGRGTFWELLHDGNFDGQTWATLTNNCCEFEGNGPTIYYPGVVINPGQWSTSADFNGDGKIDMAVSRFNPGVVTVYLNTTSTVNTNTGTDMAAQPVDNTTKMSPVSLAFSDVTQAGMTTLTTSNTGTIPPSGFQLGIPAVYYSLATTAGFSGTVSVCINYSGATFSDQTNLQLLHYSGGSWVNITTSLDTVHTTICGSTSSFSPFIVAQPLYAAQVQDPVNSDGSSVFNAKKGVVPVKFNLTLANVSTCTLPTASIVVTRTSGSTPGTIDESVYENSSDNGSYFRVSSCQYIYNLSAKALGPGTYRADIVIGTQVVGSGSFGLK